MRLHALLAGVFCLLLVLPARADMYGRQMESREPEPGVTPQPNAQLPLDAQFKDESGATVKLGAYFRNKPVIVSLVYYECPSLCNITLQGIRKAVAAGPRGLRLGQDYEIVTVSFNPKEKPTLARAKRDNYMQALGKDMQARGLAPATSGWHFLTGENTDIIRLARTVGFAYRYDRQTEQYVHASAIFICTPEGRVAQTIGGVDFSEPNVSLHDQLVRASQGRIGSGMLQVALTCGLMKFDPATGRFVHNPWMWAATIGGGLIFLTVGSFLATLWYGEYRRAHRRHPPGPGSLSPA